MANWLIAGAMLAALVGAVIAVAPTIRELYRAQRMLREMRRLSAEFAHLNVVLDGAAEAIAALGRALLAENPPRVFTSGRTEGRVWSQHSGGGIYGVQFDPGDDFKHITIT